MSDLGKSTILLLSASVVEKISPFVINAVILRYISSSEFVEFSLLIAFIVIFRVFLDFGQESFIRVEANKQSNEIYKITGSFFPWLVGLVSTAAILSIALHMGVLSHNNHLLLYLAITYGILLHLFLTLKSFCITREKSMAIFICSLLLFIIDIALFVYLFEVVKMDVLTARALSLCFSQLFGIIYLVKFWWSKLGLSVELSNINVDWQPVKYGAPMVVHAVMLSGVFYLDKKVLQRITNEDFVATTIVSASLILPLVIVADSAGKAVFPRIIKLMSMRADNEIKLILFKTVGGFFLFSILYAIFIQPIGSMYVPKRLETPAFSGLLLIMSAAPILKLISQIIGRFALFSGATWMLTTATALAGSGYLSYLILMHQTMDWVSYSIGFLGFYFLHIIFLAILSIGYRHLKQQERKKNVHKPSGL